jgi:hypothetical protein
MPMLLMPLLLLLMSQSTCFMYQARVPLQAAHVSDSTCTEVAMKFGDMQYHIHLRLQLPAIMSHGS